MVITGVIKPPPDIRAVADRTALFVARNGRAFEDRILNSEKGKTPKFSFLTASSPFHAYYEERIRFYEEGGEEGDSKDDEKKKKEEEQKREEEKKEEQLKQHEEIEKKKEKAQKASALDPLAKALLQQRAKISEARATMEMASETAAADEKAETPVGVVPPPKLSFVSAAAPALLSAVQLDTIRLVAQLAALNGPGGQFLQQLAMREWNNPLFAFIQPRHGHFAYFSALVDGYRVILSSWTEKSSPSDENTLPVTVCANSLSDTLDIAAYRAEYDRDAAKRRREEMEANGGGALGGAATIDWHDFVVVETIDFPVDEVVSTLTLPPPAATGKETLEDAMEESDEEDDGERIRVVPSYTPKVVSAQNVARDVSRTHAIDPITKESVALADTSEHMRIQLLDPKWAEERKKFTDKQKESNLVGGDVIAGNISRFAQARGDLFGTTDIDGVGKEDSKQRLAEANRVIREQAQQSVPHVPPPPPDQPAGGAGLAIPPPPPPVPLPEVPMNHPVALHAPPHAMPPPAKRQRLDLAPPNSMMPTPDEATQPSEEAPPAPGTAETEPPEEEQVKLLSEVDFAASLDSPAVKLSVQIPNDAANASWNFNGQIVTLSVDVMSKVSAVKSELRCHLGEMPLNKIQLKSGNAGFLNNNASLASLNIGPNAELEMVLKRRGGRK